MIRCCTTNEPLPTISKRLDTVTGETVAGGVIRGVEPMGA
jgi:hypothetical protein